MKTFRIRADALFDAHSLFHAFGLLIAYFAQARTGARPMLLRSGSIEVLPALPTQAIGPHSELRELRLWHWKEAKNARNAADDGRTSKHSKLDHQKAHTHHMRAVQALNDCFPVGDYADRDEELERAKNRWWPT